MIGLFSVFEVMVTRVSTNSHRYFIVIFPACISILYISNMHLL
jgi:hypothetical protein